MPLRGVCHGLAVLSHDGVVIAGSFGNGRLLALRLADGSIVGDCEAPYVTEVAADAASGLIYAVTTRGYTVLSVFQWTRSRSDHDSDGAGGCGSGRLVARRTLSSVFQRGGTGVFHRPIAVIPTTQSSAGTGSGDAGQSIAYLITAVAGNGEVEVYSLPEGVSVFCKRLVHGFECMRVVGLAAAPSGTALAVCDLESRSLHTLPWPLPGMPPRPRV